MRLHEINDAIKAICPVISINSDGKIEFDSSATDAQKIQAQSIMDTELPNLIAD